MVLAFLEGTYLYTVGRLDRGRRPTTKHKQTIHTQLFCLWTTQYSIDDEEEQSRRRRPYNIEVVVLLVLQRSSEQKMLRTTQARETSYEK